MKSLIKNKTIVIGLMVGLFVVLPIATHAQVYSSWGAASTATAINNAVNSAVNPNSSVHYATGVTYGGSSGGFIGYSSVAVPNNSNSHHHHHGGGAVTPPPPPPPAPTGTFVSYANTVAACTVTGNATDGANPSQSISVVAHKDSTTGSTLTSTCMTSSSHNFTCALNASYRGTGAHNIYLVAKGTNGTSATLTGSPKKFSCPYLHPALTVSPNPVQSGGKATVSWNTGSGYPSCTISPSVPNGTPTTINDTTTYTLTCSDGYTTSATVYVNPDITASSLYVNKNETDTISWKTHQNTGCVLSPSSKLTVDPYQHSSQTIQITGTSIYSIKCDNVATSSVTVSIIPTITPS